MNMNNVQEKNKEPSRQTPSWLCYAMCPYCTKHNRSRYPPFFFRKNPGQAGSQAGGFFLQSFFVLYKFNQPFPCYLGRRDPTAPPLRTEPRVDPYSLSPLVSGSWDDDPRGDFRVKGKSKSSASSSSLS